MKVDVTRVKDLTDAEVYEMVYQLKQCNESDPAETRRLLQDHPELARAVAQAQLRLGMIKEGTAAGSASTNTIVRCSSFYRHGMEQGDEVMILTTISTHVLSRYDTTVMTTTIFLTALSTTPT